MNSQTQGTEAELKLTEIGNNSDGISLSSEDGDPEVSVEDDSTSEAIVITDKSNARADYLKDIEVSSMSEFCYGYFSVNVE